MGKIENACETIAIQQIVTNGKRHSCCICYNHENSLSEMTKEHIISKHKDILISIATVQGLI